MHMNNLPKVTTWKHKARSQTMTVKLQVQCPNHYTTRPHSPWCGCANVLSSWILLSIAYSFMLAKHTHTHTFNGPFPWLPRWAGTRKVKPIWILLKQETVSGSGICWAICKSAPRSRQITMPAPHHSVFYRPDALPVAQPTVSKHWRHMLAKHIH